MPSSISSSDTAAARLPSLPWAVLLAAAFGIAAAFVLSMEIALALRGFHPTIVDSQAQWEKQRARASALGRRALVLVGDSRMQTDMDADALRSGSGLEPVDLGIDGSSFVPVLAGLAHDPRVTGTVVVGYSDVEVVRPDANNASAHYESDFEKTARSRALPDYHVTEAWLADRLHAVLASYADGARPSTSLLMRVFDPDARPQNVVTLPDRTRKIDFSHANLRSLGLRSAQFELDGDAHAGTGSVDDRERALLARIAALGPSDGAIHAARLAAIASYARAIGERGGRVIFVALPTAGHVREIDDRLFPRALFWDRFAAHCPGTCVRADDDPALRDLVPPDGLHVDGSDRRRFTLALVTALGLGKAPADGAGR